MVANSVVFNCVVFNWVVVNWVVANWVVFNWVVVIWMVFNWVVVGGTELGGNQGFVQTERKASFFSREIEVLLSTKQNIGPIHSLIYRVLVSQSVELLTCDLICYGGVGSKLVSYANFDPTPP